MGDFPARPRVAARRAIPDIDLRANADRLLSDIPALPLAGHDRLQLPAFLVAHPHRRAMAFGSGLVSVGAAGARPDYRRGLVDGASCHPGPRPVACCRPQAADHGLRHISDGLDHSLSSDAPGIRRHKLAGAGPVSTSDPDQPYPALPRVLLRWRRGRSDKPEAWPARQERRTRTTLAGLARVCDCVLRC